MSFEGTILNGTVVFTEPTALPEGTVVEVLVKAPRRWLQIWVRCFCDTLAWRKDCPRTQPLSTITTCMGRPSDDDRLRGHVLFRGIE